MNENIQYAFRVDADEETPCHLSEIKKGDVFYLIQGAKRSELLRATENAYEAVVNERPVWSIPHEIYY